MRVSSLSPKPASPDHATSGFTLVELLVTIVVTSILGLAVMVNFITQTRAYTVQRELAHMQQNLRAAIYMLQNDIRNSGLDPIKTGDYGIRAIGLSTGTYTDGDDLNGYPVLTLTSMNDSDGDAIADDVNPRTIIDFQVMDLNGDGRRELCRQVNGGGFQPIMDGIEDIGLAYAYDDGNGDLTRIGNNAANPEIWAIDSNNDNALDTNLDTNGDGNIDAADGLNLALPTSVPMQNIRAVRIWLLGRSRQPVQGYLDTNIYVIGRKILDMNDPVNANRRNFRHLLLTGVVALDNFTE